ncbi:MAG: polysaccharide deacetylase family protein [archaeon]
MKKAKLIIYWDYELEIEKNIPTTAGMRAGGLKSYNNTEFILDTLEKNKIKSCFAVVGYNAEKGKLPFHAPEQVKRMAKEGHEVASHGYTHRDISLLSRKELLEEFRKSKKILEKVTKQECISFAPPRNMPMRFIGFSVSLGRRYKLNKKKVSFNQILDALKEAGYKTFRVYYKGTFKKQKLKKEKGMLLIPLVFAAGFGKKSLDCVDQAIKNQGLAVVYSHTKGIDRQKEEFKKFINYIKEKQDKGKIDVITPRDLIR